MEFSLVIHVGSSGGGDSCDSSTHVVDPLEERRRRLVLRCGFQLQYELREGKGERREEVLPSDLWKAMRVYWMTSKEAYFFDETSSSSSSSDFISPHNEMLIISKLRKLLHHERQRISSSSSCSSSLRLIDRALGEVNRKGEEFLERGRRERRASEERKGGDGNYRRKRTVTTTSTLLPSSSTPTSPASSLLVKELETGKSIFDWAKSNSSSDHQRLYNRIECALFLSSSYSSSSSLSSEDAVRGVIALDSIPAGGEIVLSLPRSLILGSDIAVQWAKELIVEEKKEKTEKEKQTECDLEKDLSALSRDELLMLFVIYQKSLVDSSSSSSTSSIWSPYLSLLPSTPGEFGSAIGFGPEEMSLLASYSPNLFEVVISERENLATCYDSIFPRLSDSYPQLFPSDIFTWEAFLWTRCLFDSRAFSFTLSSPPPSFLLSSSHSLSSSFSLTTTTTLGDSEEDKEEDEEVGRGEGGGRVNCLLPLIDMCNTSFYPHLELRGSFNSTSQCFEIVSLGRIEKGEELELNYGPYSNEELILHYGFVDENNPHDFLPICFQLDQEEQEEEEEEEEEGERERDDKGAEEDDEEEEGEVEDEEEKSDKTKLQNQIWQECELDWGDSPMEREHLLRKGPLSVRLLAALRISLLNKRELKRVVASLKEREEREEEEEREGKRARRTKFDSRKPISLRNEKQTLETLISYLEVNLQSLVEIEKEEGMEIDEEEEEEEEEGDREEKGKVKEHGQQYLRALVTLQLLRKTQQNILETAIKESKTRLESLLAQDFFFSSPSAMATE